MKSTEIRFVAIHDDEPKAITKLFFDPQTLEPSSVRLAGSDTAIPIWQVKLVVVTDDNETANSITIMDAEEIPEAVKTVKKPKSKAK